MGFDHAVEKKLHPAGRDPVVVIALPSLFNLIELVRRHLRWVEPISEIEADCEFIIPAQLFQQLGIRYLFHPAEIDQLSLNSESRRARLVLVEQHAPVKTPAHVLAVERPQFVGDGLEKGGDADRLVDAQRNVADAVLERRKKRMGADVPPDLLGVVDAVGLDE